MSRIYWTAEAAGQLAELDGRSQQAIRPRVGILADFPLAGVALKREWEGFRKLSATPIPWVIIIHRPRPRDGDHRLSPARTQPMGDALAEGIRVRRLRIVSMPPFGLRSGPSGL